MDAVNAILARKLGLTPPEPDQQVDKPEALTPMRQMRRAMARAADKAVGLSASVLGIAEEELEAEALIESGPEGWIVLGLRDGSNAGLTGLFLMDPALRSALVEMQTMGNLLPPAGEERKVTRADTMLSIPFATRLLAELAELAEVGFGDEALDPAAYDLGAMDDLRTAGLVVSQGSYRSWRITVQVGGGERQGEILIAMRPTTTLTDEKPDTIPQWSQALRGALQDAPAELEAVLARMTLPMSKIEEFVVDQVLPLAGTTVGSVRLLGPSGEYIAMARLGQVAGNRAVRIEQEHIELQDDTPEYGAAPLPELGMDMPDVEMAINAPDDAMGDMVALQQDVEADAV